MFSGLWQCCSICLLRCDMDRMIPSLIIPTISALSNNQLTSLHDNVFPSQTALQTLFVSIWLFLLNDYLSMCRIAGIFLSIRSRRCPTTFLRPWHHYRHCLLQYMMTMMLLSLVMRLLQISVKQSNYVSTWCSVWVADSATVSVRCILIWDYWKLFIAHVMQRFV